MVNISIIMPVYNTAEYLRKSIGSLQRQTYTNFELICINDASTDHSLLVLEELKSQDNRITILNHEVNCGAAISRNDGLKIARGEYVICLDSDDFFYSGMLETSYNLAVKCNADLVIFGSEIINSQGKESVKTAGSFELIDHKEKKALFIPRTRHVPWDKLVRRELLLKNNIVFQDLLTNNDIFYSFAVMLVADKTVVCNEILLEYNHRRQGNLTEIRFSKKNFMVDAFYAVYQFCMQQHIDQKIKSVVLNMLTDKIQMYLSNTEYPLEIRLSSLNVFLGYQDLIDELKQQGEEGHLYPHNQIFLQKIQKGEMVCNIRYADYYIEALEEIISERRRGEKKIALWGCGKNGKELLGLMRGKNISVDYIVDECKDMQGSMYEGNKIYSFDEKQDEIDTVLITNLAYKKEIESKAYGKEVIYVWK